MPLAVSAQALSLVSYLATGPVQVEPVLSSDRKHEGWPQMRIECPLLHNIVSTPRTRSFVSVASKASSCWAEAVLVNPEGARPPTNSSRNCTGQFSAGSEAQHLGNHAKVR